MKTLEQQAKAAKSTVSDVAALSLKKRNEVLALMAKTLKQNQHKIITENKKDLQAGEKANIGNALLDRLMLNEKRIEEMVEGIHTVIKLPDPLAEVLDTWKLKSGVKVKKVRVPLGVIGIIYEARPNVTVDAAALCFKSGNAVLLRGSSSAFHSNKALENCLQSALQEAGVSKNAIQVLDDVSRETVKDMLTLKKYIDVLIPRGSAQLIDFVVEHATIPVLETGAGNCHVYIDATAKTKMAEDIVLNAKVQRPSVCNAVETVLIHEAWAKKNLLHLLQALKKQKVELHVCENTLKLVAGKIDVTRATEEDWKTEYLDYILAVKVVADVQEAVKHINTYGTKHSETIITEAKKNVEYFMTHVDAAVLYHNASTRFTDGFMFGFGAEIGISNQKLHARGPMALPELTTYQYRMFGKGQVRD